MLGPNEIQMVGAIHEGHHYLVFYDEQGRNEARAVLRRWTADPRLGLTHKAAAAIAQQITIEAKLPPGVSR